MSALRWSFFVIVIIFSNHSFGDEPRCPNPPCKACDIDNASKAIANLVCSSIIFSTKNYTYQKHKKIAWALGARARDFSCLVQANVIDEKFDLFLNPEKFQAMEDIAWQCSNWSFKDAVNKAKEYLK